MVGVGKTAHIILSCNPQLSSDADKQAVGQFLLLNDC